MIHNISRFIAALAIILLTAQGAGAVGLTTNITYVGLEASDVTVQVTYNNGATTKTVTSGQTIWDIGGQNVSVSVTSTKGIGTTFSATYKCFGSLDLALDVNQDGNTCTFTTNADYATTLNIFVTINNRYTVHYDANKGSGTMADQEFIVDEAQSLSPCTFTYSVFGTQYAFCGWNTAADGSGTGYADGESVTNLTTGGQIITLYAQWAPYFMIHFDKNAEDATGTMANQKRDNTGSVKLRANAYSREGYTFKCWNTKADGTGTSYTDCQSVGTLASRGQIVTLYAQWVAQYTVHFNANGGSGTMSDQTIGVGQAQALTANTFTRDGYYFAGWNTQTDGLGTTYNDGQSVTDLAAANETFTLYAQWKEPVTADYVDANGDAHTLTDCKEITSGHMPTSLAGNYIVSESVTYTGKVTLSGNTTIILANGKTMSIGTEAAPLGGDYALYGSGTTSLTIYGQSLDAATAGRLEVYSTSGAAVRLYEGSYAQHSGNVVVNRSGGSNNKSALKAGGSVTIDGGKLDASITSEASFAIDASGNISISGGSVTANATGADSYGMRSGGNITLTWTRATDRITASGYQSTNGTVSLSKRFAFDDGGTVTQATTANIGGQTLRPAALVTFNANGGSDVAAQTLFVGTAATEPTPTRTGYDLSGWTLGNADYDFATFVTEDITLTAQWTPDPAHFSQSGDEYTIKTATGWNVFCDALQDNDTWNRFSGKTVRLGDDITVSRMAGSQYHDFCGTFDGSGHTLTFNHGTSDSYASDEYTAPFCYVSTDTPSGGSEVPTNFRNLHVSGDIYTTAKYAAGLIARQWGTVNVENCRSSIVVHSNVTNDQNGGNDGTHGGFVSVQQSGTLRFTGCTFDGKLLTNANNVTTRCGGFVGYRSGGTSNVTNCLYAPAALADGETEVVDGNSATFVRNGAPTVTNSYYTRALGTAQGKATRTVTAAADVTIEAIALTGTATQYTVSGITAYSGGGLQRGQTLYYGSGDQLSLTLSNTATAAPRGYQYGYTASAGTLSGTTLTMPDQDVTISVNTAALAPIDWATVNQGNSADPYMIYNKDQLLLLAHRVNGTNGETANPYKGMYFKLGADITFSHDADEGNFYAENYEAIGTYIGGTYRNFKGNFDGDGHTVSGIRIRKTGSGDANSDQGLFGHIDGSANIYDVHLTDARITGYENVGGIAGYNNGGYISGCSVTDSYITATDNMYYGTICGGNYGTLTNNYYHGCTVNDTPVTSGVGCREADITADNGALPAYRLDLGANITTPPGTFVGDGESFATPPDGARLAPENGFTLAGNHYFASGYVFTPGSTLASGAAQGYTPRATLGGQLLDLYTPTGDADPLAGNAIAQFTITADCDGKTLASTQAIYSTGQPVTVAYIKADGTPGEASAIALDGTETSLAAGWYFVGKDISYTQTLTLTGDVNLILADGKTMNVGTSGSRISGHGIAREDGADQALTIYGQNAGTGALNVYTGNGNKGIVAKAVTINGGNVTTDANGNWATGIKAGDEDITINGGNVSVTATGTSARAIYAYNNVTINGGTVEASGTADGIRTDNGDITINGGNVTATGGGSGTDYGINASYGNGNITLGWTNATDRITASSISTGGGGTVAVADGQALTDGSGHIYTGTLTASELSGFAAETTLQPCLALADAADNNAAITDHAGQTLAVALSGRTLYKDGSWNTLCLPFAVDLTASGTLSGDNVQAMTLDTTTSTFADGTLTLNFTDATTIPAGTPFIIKWDGDGSSNITNPVFEGVTVSNTTNNATVEGVLTFTGTYTPKDIGEDGDNTILYLGAANKLYYPTKSMTIGTHRAYFQLLGDLTAGEPVSGSNAQQIRAFNLNFGDDESTGIISVHDSGFTVNASAAWYTLDGRRLDAQPTAKGLYIHGGKKVIVK